MLVLYSVKLYKSQAFITLFTSGSGLFEYVKWYVLLTHRQEVILLSEPFLDWGEPADPIEKNTVFIG